MQEFYNECEDKFHDECGVVGVYLNPEDEKIKAGKKNAAVLSYYALVSLQHRGQIFIKGDFYYERKCKNSQGNGACF